MPHAAKGHDAVLAQDNTNFAYDSYYKCFLSAAKRAAANSQQQALNRGHFALILQMKSYCWEFLAPSTLPFLLMSSESIVAVCQSNNSSNKRNQKYISSAQYNDVDFCWHLVALCLALAHTTYPFSRSLFVFLPVHLTPTPIVYLLC